MRRESATEIAILLAALVVSCGGGTTDPPAGPAPAPDDPRVYGSVPAFELTDQFGETFGSEQLSGIAWVGNFIFTSCPGTCPVQTQYVKQLQDRLESGDGPGEVRLVSFTVDPNTDTPEVLREYAEAVGADPERWTFVTGTRESLWRLSKDGFKLPVGDAPPGGDGPILHATQLILVDGDGRVRGYYDGMSEQGLADLQADLDKIL